MLFPCEMVVSKILPSLKAQLVKELYSTFKFNQEKIAKTLGITQPSVSLYLNDERGRFNELFNMESAQKQLNKLQEICENVVNDSISEQTIMEQICQICSKLRKDGVLCAIHANLDKNREESCGFCESTWKV